MQTLGFAYQAVDSSMVATYTVTSSGSGTNNGIAGSSDWNGMNSIPCVKICVAAVLQHSGLISSMLLAF
jgi:hypothetical protein